MSARVRNREGGGIEIRKRREFRLYWGHGWRYEWRHQQNHSFGVFCVNENVDGGRE
jgi:hypothetical protein